LDPTVRRIGQERHFGNLRCKRYYPPRLVTPVGAAEANVLREHDDRGKEVLRPSDHHRPHPEDVVLSGGSVNYVVRVTPRYPHIPA
jgi:hypothetical protein